jgi:Acetyltransferase (GNAT) domain
VITELFNVGGERIWLIQLRDTGEIIGTCGFRPLAPHSRDFGYCLGPRWWGRGITPEVTRLLIAEMESDPTVFCSTPRRSGDNAHIPTRRPQGAMFPWYEGATEAMGGNDAERI